MPDAVELRTQVQVGVSVSLSHRRSGAGSWLYVSDAPAKSALSLTTPYCECSGTPRGAAVRCAGRLQRRVLLGKIHAVLIGCARLAAAGGVPCAGSRKLK